MEERPRNTNSKTVTCKHVTNEPSKETRLLVSLITPNRCIVLKPRS